MIYDVRDYGARGDGYTVNTAAIQAALNDARKTGGTVLIEGGRFVSGTLCLPSDITLRIEAGSALVGSRDIRDYRDCGFYHNEMKVTTSLLYALGEENITLTGEGKIDLSGDAFADFSKPFPSGADESTLTDEEKDQMVVSPKERPTQPIIFHDCRDIRIHDLTVLNAPCWTMTFSCCERIRIHDITVNNEVHIPNNDGMHFSASRDIVVSDSVILCGDDCIACTCITKEDGVCENIVISDCVLSSRSAAIRFGHLMSHVRRAAVNNVVIRESNRGIALFARDGGVVEDITVSNVISDTKIYAGAWWGKGEPIVLCAADSTGIIRHISFRGITAETENPILICGKDGNVTDITLSDCDIRVRRGKTNPYFMDKLDLQPNRPCVPAPFTFGDKIYVEGAGKLITDLAND